MVGTSPACPPGPLLQSAHAQPRAGSRTASARQRSRPATLRQQRRRTSRHAKNVYVHTPLRLFQRLDVAEPHARHAVWASVWSLTWNQSNGPGHAGRLCLFFSLAKQCMHAPASHRLCIPQRQRGQTEGANARLASGRGYKLNTNPVLQASVTSCEPQVVWAEGATQTGSSGAPLIDAASGRAVGALTGGFATCASAGGADFFGRLASEVRAPAPAARRIHCGSCGGLSLCPTRAQAAWRSCMGGEDRWHARAHAPACIKTLPDVAAM